MVPLDVHIDILALLLPYLLLWRMEISDLSSVLLNFLAYFCLLFNFFPFND